MPAPDTASNASVRSVSGQPASHASTLRKKSITPMRVLLRRIKRRMHRAPWFLPPHQTARQCPRAVGAPPHFGRLGLATDARFPPIALRSELDTLLFGQFAAEG